MRLYFKKLLSSLFFFLAFFIVFCLLAFVWVLVLGDEFAATARFGVIFVASGIITIGGVIKQRCRPGIKAEFLKQEELDTLSFGVDFSETLCSKENLVHAAAMATLFLLLCVGVSVGDPIRVSVFFITCVLLFLMFGAAFLFINTLLWCLIHRLWLHSSHKQ